MNERIKFINSNTTLVKVKCSQKLRCHIFLSNSNTTLVKVKLDLIQDIIYRFLNSNTTLVKVKWSAPPCSSHFLTFKYNSC